MLTSARINSVSNPLTVHSYACILLRRVQILELWEYTFPSPEFSLIHSLCRGLMSNRRQWTEWSGEFFPRPWTPIQEAKENRKKNSYEKKGNFHSISKNSDSRFESIAEMSQIGTWNGTMSISGESKRAQSFLVQPALMYMRLSMWILNIICGMHAISIMQLPQGTIWNHKQAKWKCMAQHRMRLICYYILI